MSYVIPTNPLSLTRVRISSTAQLEGAQTYILHYDLVLCISNAIIPVIVSVLPVPGGPCINYIAYFFNFNT